jgi:adenylate cyclase
VAGGFLELGSGSLFYTRACAHEGCVFCAPNVGTVGEGDALDFTALGDAVNTAARLGADAGPGEILISDATASAAQLDTAGLETRHLSLRGRERVLDAFVARS